MIVNSGDSTPPHTFVDLDIPPQAVVGIQRACEHMPKTVVMTRSSSYPVVALIWFILVHASRLAVVEADAPPTDDECPRETFEMNGYVRLLTAGVCEIDSNRLLVFSIFTAIFGPFDLTPARAHGDTVHI